ncbi:MAG: hypothetical protein VCE74_01130 [Alphaproteobacteria bacterium]
MTPEIDHGPARAGDIYKSLGNPERLEAPFGFSAGTDLTPGLAATLA